MVGFSVDYQFVQGQPPSSVSYFLVIKRSQGTAARIPVPSKTKGNLTFFPLPPWRPEEGPFQAHVEDSIASPVSDPIDMRSP